jgi:opacity protein-like surface antigen
MAARKFLLGAACVFIATTSSGPASAQWLGPLYARGEAAWSGTTNANVHDQNFPLDHGITGPNGNAGTLSNIGSGWLIGGGLGAYFFEHFRGEIVYTYRGGYRLNQFDAGTPATQFMADLTSNSVMANGYADFPLVRLGIVPFVGFGVGWSEIKMSNLTATKAGMLSTAPGGTSDNFGWQLTAGVGFTVTNGVKADIFYRYFDGGHIKTRAGNIVSAGTIVDTYQGAEGAFHAHEIGLSLRIPLG